MQYGKAFTFAITKPKTGLQNILLGVVCLFIPIIGQIVWLGYRGYVASDLEDDPDLTYHRDFRFDRFSKYLTRGVWQFLAQLLLGSIVMVGYIGMFIAMMATTAGTPGPAAGAGPGGPPAMVLAILIGGYAAIFLLVVIGTFFIWPLELYAALAEEVSVSRAFAFAGRFVRLMWGEMVVAVIVYFILSLVTMLLGALACCVGLYPAIVIMSLAEIHIMVQLYRSYLDKGGMAIRDLDAMHELSDAD
jgi:hypothetical protein